MSEVKIALENKVREILRTTLGDEIDEFKNDANLKEDLGADSLDAVEIIMNVEKEFGINIPDEEADKLHTVQSIVSYLESQNVKA